MMKRSHLAMVILFAVFAAPANAEMSDTDRQACQSADEDKKPDLTITACSKVLQSRDGRIISRLSAAGLVTREADIMDHLWIVHDRPSHRVSG